MSRVIDFLVILAAVIMVMITQMMGAAFLDPLRDELLEDGIDEEYNAEEEFGQDFVMVTKWVPWAGLLGAIVLAGYREYRRQRLVASARLR